VPSVLSDTDDEDEREGNYGLGSMSHRLLDGTEDRVAFGVEHLYPDPVPVAKEMCEGLDALDGLYHPVLQYAGVAPVEVLLREG